MNYRTREWALRRILLIEILNKVAEISILRIAVIKKSDSLESPNICYS
jgi:hypothetical protein